MEIDKLIEGVQIIKKYISADDTGFVSAEHDIIYFPNADIPEDSDDFKNLKELGFHYETEFDCWAKFV